MTQSACPRAPEAVTAPFACQSLHKPLCLYHFVRSLGLDPNDVGSDKKNWGRRRGGLWLRGNGGEAMRPFFVVSVETFVVT